MVRRSEAHRLVDQGRVDDAEGRPSRELAERLGYTTRDRRPGRSALDPYSPFVHKQILDAAKRSCRETVERVTVLGAQCLRDGVDPRVPDGPTRQNGTSGGWSKQANIVWELESVLDRGEAMTTRYLMQAAGKGFFNGGAEARRISEVCRLLYPTRARPLPVLIRLVLQTRLPPECVLRADDRRPSRGSEEDLRYVKRRTGTKELLEMRIPGAAAPRWGGCSSSCRGSWAHSRRRSPSTALWLCHAVSGQKAGSHVRFSLRCRGSSAGSRTCGTPDGRRSRASTCAACERRRRRSG